MKVSFCHLKSFCHRQWYVPHSTLHPDEGKNWKVSNRACKDLLAVPGRLHSWWVEDDKKDSHHAIIIYGETNERYWRHCKTSFLLLLFWGQKFTKSWEDAIQYLSSYFDLQELAKICLVWFCFEYALFGVQIWDSVWGKVLQQADPDVDILLEHLLSSLF